LLIAEECPLAISKYPNGYISDLHRLATKELCKALDCKHKNTAHEQQIEIKITFGC
jgi:hypothetical protein